MATWQLLGLVLKAPSSFYQEMHECTAVIELPYNISDILDNNVFLVEVFPADVEVQLLTSSRNYEFNHNEMNWTAAEEFCVSKGGHLASTRQDWESLQESMQMFCLKKGLR